MESNMLYIISLLCPRLKVLLSSKWQSQTEAVQHKPLGTLKSAPV